MTIKMTRRQLNYIIEKNLLSEVTQDYTVNTGFKITLTSCDLSNLDNRFIKVFTSPTESILAKVRTGLVDINLEGLFSLLNIVVIPLKMAGVLLHSGQLILNSIDDEFFNVLKKIASITAWTTMIPLGNICDTLVRISEIIGDVVGPLFGLSKTASPSLSSSSNAKDRAEYISGFINGLKNEFDINKKVSDLSAQIANMSINALVYMCIFMPETSQNYIDRTRTLLGDTIVKSESKYVKSLLEEMNNTSKSTSYSGIRSVFSGKTIFAIPFTNTSKIESVFNSLGNPTDYYDQPADFINDLSLGLRDIKKEGLFFSA